MNKPIMVKAEPVRNPASLAMHAKHDSDEDVRLETGLLLVESLSASGDYAMLISVSADREFIGPVRQAARDAILPAAELKAESSGSLEPLHDISCRDDIPSLTRQNAIHMLDSTYSKNHDAAGLMRIACDERIYYEEREVAAKIVCRWHILEKKGGPLAAMAKDDRVPYEVRKSAGSAAIELAAEGGNYPILISFASDNVPLDVKLEAAEKLPEAATKCISQARLANDAAMLNDIASDERLPKDIRSRAANATASMQRQSAPSPAEANTFSRARASPTFHIHTSRLEKLKR